MKTVADALLTSATIRLSYMSTLVGMQLSGRYRLEAQIGAAGCRRSTARSTQTLERRVAIKLMHREIAPRLATSSSASAARRAPSRSSRTRTSSA